MKPSRPIGVTTSKPLGWTDHLRTADMEVRVGQLGVIQGDLGPLRCRAVGATVAICFAVEEDRVAGVLHVGFPSARQHRALATSHPLLFADRAIAHLETVLAGRGFAPSEVVVRVVGAGGLLDNSAPLDGPGRLLRSVEVALTAHGYAIRDRHVGGSLARTLTQHADGRLLLMMPGGQR